MQRFCCCWDGLSSALGPSPRQGRRRDGEDGGNHRRAVVVFGDSYSDAGLCGLGLASAAPAAATAAAFPAAALAEPARRLEERFGSLYPFKQYGYVDHAATNGKTWAHALEDVRPGLTAYNFAHTSASSCQEVKAEEGLGFEVAAPEGYKGVKTQSGLGLLYPRGVAQQLRQAKAMLAAGQLPADLFQSALVVVFIGTNDFFYTWAERSTSRPSAVGNGPSDAGSCLLVENYRTICRELVEDLRVPAANIVLAGLPAVELIPKVRESFPEDLPAIALQADAVNRELGCLGFGRWGVAEWMRGHMREETPSVICRVYEALPQVSGPEDLPAAPAAAAGGELWFDEIHPSAAVHRRWAEDFAARFL